MPGQIDICNRALSILGTRSTIASLTEASEEALQCSIHFQGVLDGLLRVHLWSFARMQVALALLGAAAGTPENPDGTGGLSLAPWAYKYAQPVDCLRVRSLTGYCDSSGYASGIVGMASGTSSGATAYGLSGDHDSAGNAIRVILANIPQAQLVYTARINDPNMWDAEFQEAFVYLLAARLCGPLSGDKSLTNLYLQSAQQAILQARTVDAAETPTSTEHLPDWLQVRGYPMGSGGPNSLDYGLLNSLLGS
jgi:hypothetical protein